MKSLQMLLLLLFSGMQLHGMEPVDTDAQKIKTIQIVITLFRDEQFDEEFWKKTLLATNEAIDESEKREDYVAWRAKMLQLITLIIDKQLTKGIRNRFEILTSDKYISELDAQLNC
jgi:hypothetical protein